MHTSCLGPDPVLAFAILNLHVNSRKERVKKKRKVCVECWDNGMIEVDDELMKKSLAPACEPLKRKKIKKIPRNKFYLRKWTILTPRIYT
jgi:hypothetical protein